MTAAKLNRKIPTKRILTQRILNPRILNGRILSSIIVFGLCALLLAALAGAAVKTFTVKETDLVKIVPEASDLDNDQLKYYYASPLNDKGEWQTTYGDAGEYDINITASDGQIPVVQRIKLIVEKKNRAPEILEQKIVAKETQVINLRSLVKDPDGDPLEYVFYAPFDKNGMWKPDFGDSQKWGSFVANFAVSDGEATVKARVEIEVLPTNQEPGVIESFSDEKKISLEEDDTLGFYAMVNDSDGDKLSFRWELDGQEIDVETNVLGSAASTIVASAGEYYFGYNASGEYLLRVEVSDGTATVEKKWELEVEDKRREPEFMLPSSLTVKEGEKVALELTSVDQDGNNLTYSFSGAPMNEKGEWLTNYEDAGEYLVDVEAFNGEYSAEKEMLLKVLNVDRPPFLELPENLTLYEGELFQLVIPAKDPDGEKVIVTAKDLPPGATFLNNTLTWTPSYDTVKRRANFFTNMLNALRLERHFLGTEKFTVNVTSCGEELCTSKSFNFLVKNQNRAPVFSSPASSFGIKVKETEKARLKAPARDPDGDIVRYYYTAPLGKRDGKWNTDYGDKGNYTIYVTATDGKLSSTIPIDMEVAKNNRAPTLKLNDDKLLVNEKQEFMFKVSTSDADGDNLTLRLDHLPLGASFNNGVFLWAPGQDTVKNKTSIWWNNFVSDFNSLNKKFNTEKAVVWLSFVASDKEVDTVHPVKVTVKNVNRAPEIIDHLPLEGAAGTVIATVNVPLTFYVTAKDADGDALSYTWDFGGWKEELVGTSAVQRTFTLPGEKMVKVTVSDGRDSVEKEWEVMVMEQPLPEVKPEEIPFTVKVYVMEGK